MSANSASCTIIGHADGHASIGDYSQSAAKYAGYAGGSSYYAYALKFTTPDFLGASESVDFSLLMNNGMGADVTLRYALCSSDANKNMYCGTTEEVADPYQIATGTVQLNGMTSAVEQRSVSVPTVALTPNTTYYLLLWAYNDTGVSLKQVSSAWGDYVVTLGYNSGLIFIDNGTTVEAYQLYIDNGTDWDLLILHVEDGSDWYLLS